VDDIRDALFWLRLVQLLIAIPLLALAAQGVLHVLTRAFGQDPHMNVFYRVLVVVSAPVTRVCRWITPRFVADRVVPVVALCLLAVGYLWTMLAIADVCHRHAFPVAQCLAR